MPSVAEKLLAVCPIVSAAVLLLGRTLSHSLSLPAPTVPQIIEATDASRSSAYELVDVLVELLPTLVPTRGRPPKPEPTQAPQSGTLTDVVLAYVMAHPGSVERGPVRQHYSDGFRRLVVDLRAEHVTLELEVFAQATHVPLGTLKDWLSHPATACAMPASSEPESACEERESSEQSAQMQTVLDAWPRWQGTFVGFCAHVRGELRVPFGNEMVARILWVHNLRRPARRAGRSPDESALRGAFRTYFPDAQWVGDGMQVPVLVNGQRITVNLELDVDAYSGAFTGASVRHEEDASAVIEAFQDGVHTTGKAPIGLLLDNRPSNHTSEVDIALGDTLRMRATPARPQNKAHVEGAFGLFSQVLPELVLDTRRSPEELALAFVSVVVQVWARTTNHRPRADRGGRSRVEIHSEQPSEEQLEQARRELRETVERQDKARRTLEARRRPEVLSLLDTSFKRLGLLDPERNIRIAIAGHSLDAIVDGLGIFEAKQLAHTLPEGVDARYLLGIVRNIDAQAEGEHIARRLFALRLEVRDTMLASLVAARETVCEGDNIVSDCVDRALDTSSPLERTFWLDSLAEVILCGEPTQHDALYRAAARRIEATFAISPRERHDAVRRLADRIVSLA